MENSILLVDDEPNVIKSLKRALVDEPYEIYSADSGEKGLEVLRKHKMKVVISDEMMPGMTGVKFLSVAKMRHQDTIRILLTGHANLDVTMMAVNSGEIYRFFTKPWNDIELKLALRSAVEKYDLETYNKKLLETVKRQAVEIKLLEKRYPGIASLERDDHGMIDLPEMSEEEYESIVANCDRKFK
jgi:two-component system probable response regulator PhcQ